MDKCYIVYCESYDPGIEDSMSYPEVEHICATKEIATLRLREEYMDLYKQRHEKKLRFSGVKYEDFGDTLEYVINEMGHLVVRTYIKEHSFENS